MTHYFKKKRKRKKNLEFIFIEIEVKGLPGADSYTLK
jgi:hypothetical protein